MSVEQPEAYNVRSQRVLLQIEVSGDAAAAAAIVVNCIDVNGDVSRARGQLTQCKVVMTTLTKLQHGGSRRGKEFSQRRYDAKVATIYELSKELRR